MNAKRRQQFRHAKRRANERFGIHLDQNSECQMVKQIQNGQAKLLDRQSQRISVWGIEIQGQKVAVVYDNVRKAIVTFMYPNMGTPTC